MSYIPYYIVKLQYLIWFGDKSDLTAQCTSKEQYLQVWLGRSVNTILSWPEVVWSNMSYHDMTISDLVETDLIWSDLTSFAQAKGGPASSSSKIGLAGQLGSQ